MTTSGLTSFNLDLNDMVEEAFERAGSELRTGYDLRTARRSLNLLFADWANRGVNMWTFEQNTITLSDSPKAATIMRMLRQFRNTENSWNKDLLPEVKPQDSACRYPGQAVASHPWCSCVRGAGGPCSQS